MSSPNGVALLGARRLRVAYETKTYIVEAPDGETVSLAGYVRGPGCPISVEIGVEDAWAEWSEDVPSREDQEAMTNHRILARTNRAWRMLRSTMLCAVIPGLPKPAADLLAIDDGPWEGVLVELGWWAKAEPTEQIPEGEAEAGDSSLSTGSPASADSSPVTAMTPSSQGSPRATSRGSKAGSRPRKLAG